MFEALMLVEHIYGMYAKISDHIYKTADSDSQFYILHALLMTTTEGFESLNLRAE